MDIAGNQIVARGPELAPGGDLTPAFVDAIAATGANAMRLLILLDAENGLTPAIIDRVLAEAQAKHMLVWVSLITFTGNIGAEFGGGQVYSLPTSAGLPACSSDTPTSCYAAIWGRQWLKDLATKYKSNIIVDAMQEWGPPPGVDASTEPARVEWRDAAKAFLVFFRSQGYTNPLEFMSNYGGRDLYAIHEYGSQIAAVDTVVVNGTPQTMFGWQAYWGTTDNWYPMWQGSLFGVGTLTGTQAITQYVPNEPFPIEIGIDNFAGDTNLTYQAEIDAAASISGNWLWWDWQGGASGQVNCPVSGAPCVSYVETSANGFAGAKLLTTP
jgi:hypothetical protein